MQKVWDKALDYFRGPDNCCEAILRAIAEEYEIEHEHIPNIGSGFGSGIAGKGYVCGAIIGCVMGIGLLYSKSTLSGKERKNEICRRVLEFLDEFESKYKSTNCLDLIKFEIISKEGIIDLRRQNIRDLVQKGIIKLKCDDYIIDVTKFLAKIAENVRIKNQGSIKLPDSRPLL